MDLALHILLSPDDLSLDEVPSFCAAIRRGGATVVQLRAKVVPVRTMIAYGRALRDATREQGLGFVVNDRLDVAMAVHADGVHVGQDDIPVPLVRAIAPYLLVGLSVSSQAEAQEALRLRPDYLGVGPVFHTWSKEDAGIPLGEKGLAEISTVVQDSLPMVAIGGITSQNAGTVWHYPVSGLAVISAVMGAIDKEDACRKLCDARKESHHG